MRPKRVAITQSNYIPWKGYFDLINSVDHLILYDDVQYTRRSWRNRNRIKTVGGPTWLTIPVKVKGRYLQQIDETRIADSRWAGRHWKSISQSYRNAPYFELYREAFEEVYLSPQPELLSEVNRAFLTTIAGLLGISTSFSASSDYEIAGDRTGRLVDLCRKVGATEYLSGPSARSYLAESQFEEAGLHISWADDFGASRYPEYPQLHGPFEHAVTIVDLLFCTGPFASAFMRSFEAHDELPAELAMP